MVENRTQLKDAKLYVGKDDYMHFDLLVLGTPVTKGFDKEHIEAVQVWNDKISYVTCGDDIYEPTKEGWILV